MATEKIIKDKSVVITGGAAGIGLSMAEHFLKRGARKLIILDIDEKLGNEAEQKLNSKYGSNKVIFIHSDVADESLMNETFEKIIKFAQQIDVFVNNAGIFNESQWKKVLDINLVALVSWSLKIWNYMRKDKSGNGGTIINISSICGFRISQFAPVYTATKFGVYSFTKSLGHDINYKQTKVRVFALCPGSTKTDLNHTENIIDNHRVLDEYLNESFKASAKAFMLLDVDAVGEAVVNIFEKSDSGKVWRIQGEFPFGEIKTDMEDSST